MPVAVHLDWRSPESTSAMIIHWRVQVQGTSNMPLNLTTLLEASVRTDLQAASRASQKCSLVRWNILTIITILRICMLGHFSNSTTNNYLNEFKTFCGNVNLNVYWNPQNLLLNLGYFIFKMFVLLMMRIFLIFFLLISLFEVF